MATIEIPESLRAYYCNKAVRRAVDELVGKLNGADMPDCDWDEAKKYNQALLMAAQVRTDYVALLFDLWDATFGKSDPQHLKGEYFDHELLSPNQIWDKECQCLCKDYYRSGDPEQGGRCDELRVCLSEDSLELSVYRFNDDEELDHSKTPEVEGWSTKHDDTWGGQYLANKSVSTEEFLSEPKQVIDRFAEDAAKVIEVLLKS